MTGLKILLKYKQIVSSYSNTENSVRTYFSANTSINTLAQLNFSICSFYFQRLKKNMFLFDHSMVMSKFNSVFTQAR